MPNNNQLNLLTSAQSAAIDAALLARTLKVAELVKISWPSPDNAKVYAWWNCLADSAYTTPLTDWLAGAPLIPAFIAADQNKAERFHDIPRTAALSDDVIQMSFANYGRVFEALCYKWRGGVRVEVFYFFPEIANDATGKSYTAISWFLGHLRKADRANADFVQVTVRNGFRSPHVLVPGRIQGSNCQWYYNGDVDASGSRVFPTGLPGNPCDIDKHFGGTRGTVDPGTGLLWAECNKTLDDCIKINGDEDAAREIYGGDDYVTESTQIGRGDHRTVSRTVGNEIRLENVRVVYGKRHVKSVHLKRYAKEYNPSEDNQDKGTIRTVFGVCEGPITSISEVKVMDRSLPRPDGLGLEVRLGTQRQPATTYASDMLPLNRTAHFRGDINPVDPNGVQSSDIVGECVVEGRSTVRIYDAGGTYTQGYTNNRADCMADLLTDDAQYGYKMDAARIHLQDIVDLRALNSPLDADVQQRTIQQHIEDICLAAVGTNTPGWFRPFVYNGKWRFLAIRNSDLTLSDIPQIKSNFGATRNVLFDRARNVALLEFGYKDNDEIPNAYTVTIEDADKGNIERPLTFNADLEQYYEGKRFGDFSKRRDPKTVAGFGLTTEAPARVLGEFLVKMGPFATGGLMNNGALSFKLCAVSSLALNLHENKLVKLPTADNSALSPYTDEDGNQFQYFIVLGMRRTSRLELDVDLQVWSKKFWDTFCFEPGGSQSGYVTWITPDDDVIDGLHGVKTQIFSVTADRSANGKVYPDGLSGITLARWTHEIAQLPSDGYSYNVTHPTPVLGFKVWHNGQGWIYHGSGIDTTTLGEDALIAGDKLTVEYDDNGGSPVRRYKLNEVTLHTDTTGVTLLQEISGVCVTTGDLIGDVFWEVVYSGCTADYAIQGVGQSGGSTTGSGEEPFDLLAYQVFDRPEDLLQVEMFSENL